MDRIDALIALANLKLRIEILQRNPSLLDSLQETAMANVPPAIKMPIQLAGLKSRLHRAKLLETKAGELGTRFDAALDGIDTAIAAGVAHAGQLEQYGNDLLSTINGMIDTGSNGAPEDGANPTQAGEPAPLPGPNGGPRFPNQA
ncbi:hypothetical protein ACRAVF_19045 [Bradyrhizobium oligotrophicum S58]